MQAYKDPLGNQGVSEVVLLELGMWEASWPTWWPSRKPMCPKWGADDHPSKVDAANQSCPVRTF